MAAKKSIKSAEVTTNKAKYAYTGKAIKAGVTVKLGKKTLKKGTDYTVSYKNNKKIGKATVTVKGKGNYSGSCKTTFKIVPKKVTGLKTSSVKTTLGKLSWKKISNADGYRVYQYNSSTKAYERIKTIKSNTTTSYTVKGLKAGKTYKFKVLAYKKANSKDYAGAYSAVVKMTTAKVKEPSMAEQLRKAGENEFYDVVEFAELYKWKVDNVKIIRENDNEFMIYGEFTAYSTPSKNPIAAFACRAFISSGSVKTEWCSVKHPFKDGMIGDDGFCVPGYNYSYDDFECPGANAKDDIITSIKMLGGDPNK